MPRSAAGKDISKFRSKRYFYLRDTEAELQQQNRDVRYIGAHVYVNGNVVTYGMGLEQDVTADVSASAMKHVMKLMAEELARRHLV